MQEKRNVAVVIVGLRAFKWTLRRTLNIPTPFSECLSHTHVSGGKFSSKLSAVQAEK
jgi:hypothetical protein